MRRISKLNIQKSISKEKLVFHEEGLDVLDRLVVYLFSFGLVVTSLFSITIVDFENSNEAFLAWTFMPIGILLGLYLGYRKATEKHLYNITTPFNISENKELLLEYAVKQKLEVYRKANQCLILNEPISDIISSKCKSIIILIKDNHVLFTVLVDNYGLNFPTLVSHLWLKHDLKKLFGNRENIH